MSTPLPKRRVRGSKTGRPIMALLDLLSRRKALRILWEMRRLDRLTFRALQDAADTNPAVLNSRLKELREARIVDHEQGGYAVTPLGADLLKILGPLNKWADGWAVALEEGRDDA